MSHLDQHQNKDLSSADKSAERILGSKDIQIHFTDEQRYQFMGFFKTLEKIHYRLVAEGYLIRDGQLLPPIKN